MSVDRYVEHFEPLMPPEDVYEAGRYLVERCPVAHSDRDGGFWVVNRYADLLTVLQDWHTFENGHTLIPEPPAGAGFPPMPPIDSNPPLHRHFREVLNPYLTPDAVAKHEPNVRRMISGLIEAFAPRGSCDIATELAHLFPPMITFRELFSLTDEEELRRVEGWVHTMTFGLHREPPEVVLQARTDWMRWIEELIERRRRGPRQDDMIDGLLHGTVEGGRRIRDDEVLGAILILTLGGFGTTSDATSNLVLQLTREPGLEARLRADHELIPAVIEEVLRLEPPVTALARLCVKDTELAGHRISAGDRVMINFSAANRDPAAFERPDEFIPDRPRNRHLSFSGGPHRCIGSNFARMSLRVMLEELLARARDISLASPEGARRVSEIAAWRTVESLPILFTPILP
jgi:cytochrome P450